MQVTLGIQVADIAGVQPAVDDGFRSLVRCLEIALHDEIATHADFTGLALRQHLTLIIQDLDANQRVRPPTEDNRSSDAIFPLTKCSAGVR